MLDPEYPCAICKCAQWKHYKSLSTGKAVCLICVMDSLAGNKKPKYEPVHEFEPDNLVWLEMKALEEMSQKGIPGVKYGS